jgi:hypothetical protein
MQVLDERKVQLFQQHTFYVQGKTLDYLTQPEDNLKENVDT